jgi:hypothetical protein
MEKENLQSSGTSTVSQTEPNLLGDELGVGKLLLEAEEMEKKQKEQKQEQQPEQQQQLILGRFKSYADLEKAYKELEKVYTQTSQELSKLRKNTEQQQEKQEKKQEEYDPDKFYEEFINNPKDVIKQIIKEEVEPLRQSIQPLQIEREMQYIRNVIDNFKAQHPDFDQYEAQITEIINNEIPANSNLTAQQLLEIGYAMAKARNVNKVVEQAKQATQQELLSKQKAFVETNTGAAQRFLEKTKKTPEEEIKESIVAAEATNPLLE